MTSVPSFAILLIQVDDQDASRVWAEYSSYQQAIEELMQMVEDLIKATRKNAGAEITYDLEEYLNFYDRIKEVVILK
jgi:cytochrome P450